MIGAVTSWVLSQAPGLAVGVGLGITFTESIRLMVRKVTKGRFFGPVPEKPLELKK